MRLNELIQDLEGARVIGEGGVAISDLAYRSDAVSAGVCFVAMPGSRVDGHDYIPDAVARGAVAIVAEREISVPAGTTLVLVPSATIALAHMAVRLLRDPSGEMCLIGVTGTNGKTTTTWILEAILAEAGRRPGVIGTVAYRYAGQSFRAPHTTPLSLDLQRLLRDMVDAGVDACAMEVSSHALEQERATGCQFDAAVFTNLTPEHLDYHGDMETYFAAKARLFEERLTHEGKDGAHAVINVDDPRGRELAARLTVPVVRYGLEHDADVRGYDLFCDAAGIGMTIATPDGMWACRTPLCGRFNASNVLAAVAVAWRCGIEASVIQRALEGMRAVPGRFEAVPNDRGVLAIVDYAHTPDALENVVAHARELVAPAGGRLVVVFGCGGDRDRAKRPLMGRAVAVGADVVIVTSDNPRTEDPAAIIEEILPGVCDKAMPFAGDRGFEVIIDRRAAIERAVKASRLGDVLLVAGKGHEDYQIVGHERRSFDDRAVLREFLQGAGCAADCGA